MRIVHLSSVHRIGDPRLFHMQVAAAVAAGHEVVVVAVAEADRMVEGVRVCAIRPARNRLQRMTLRALDVLRAAAAEPADLYLFHDPELIPVGLWLKLKGKRVVYDAREDTPRLILTKHWIAPWLRRLVALALSGLENLSVRILDGVVIANPPARRRFPPERTVLVRNFPALATFEAAPQRPYAGRPPVAVYVGSLTSVRGVRELVTAVGLLPERLGARLDLAGRFDEPGLECACRALPGWARVTYHGWQERSGVARLLAGARLGVVPLHATANHLEAYPQKMFEYMAMGLPVVISDIPMWREIVQEVGCGLVVAPQDPEALAAAIGRLLEQPAAAEAMGRRGQAAVRARYNWQNEARSLIAFYRRMAA